MHLFMHIYMYMCIQGHIYLGFISTGCSPLHARIHAYLHVYVYSGTRIRANDYFRVMCIYLFGFNLHRMLAPRMHLFMHRTNIYVFIYTHIYLCIQVHAYLHVYTNIGTQIHKLTSCCCKLASCASRRRISMHTYMYIYISIYTYTNICICIYIFMYIYTHTYILACIHRHTQKPAAAANRQAVHLEGAHPCIHICIHT